MGAGVMSEHLSPEEIEAIFIQLDDEDQAAHIGACWVARAAVRRRNFPDIVAQCIDSETVDAFAELEPLVDRLVRRAERSRLVGIDDDLIGCNIARGLLGAGHTEEDTARLIAEAGIDWHRRTADERLVAAATELLVMGMDPDAAEDAFAGLDVT
jgi:hypothetical protein